MSVEISMKVAAALTAGVGDDARRGVDLHRQRLGRHGRRQVADGHEVVDRVGEHQREAREDGRVQQRQQDAADRLRRRRAQVHRRLLVLGPIVSNRARTMITG